MYSLKVELGDWVSVHGVVGHVCGRQNQDGGLFVEHIDVCFRPHSFRGYSFADHRTLTPPFVGVCVIGKMAAEPFNPYGQETKDIDFGFAR